MPHEVRFLLLGDFKELLAVDAVLAKLVSVRELLSRDFYRVDSGY